MDVLIPKREHPPTIKAIAVMLITEFKENFTLRKKTPIARKSYKDWFNSSRITEYFELCEISSKIQCPDCSLYWEVGIENCTCGKCVQPSGRNRQCNKDRYDVLSIFGYDILDRWNNDKYRTSLSDIGWNERKMQCDTHWKTIPTLQDKKSEREIMDTFIECRGIQKPLNQRSDFKAKQTWKRLHEYTAITGSGNKRIPPEQPVRQRRDQQFEGLEEYDYRHEASTGWRYYSSSTTHSSSSSPSRWQPSSDLWSTWNRDSRKLHPGVNSEIFLSPAGNLIFWQSTGGVIRTPAAYTFFSCLFCQRACPSLLSQVFGLQPHSHALTPRTAWLNE